jgi:DUF1680 family protein
MLKLTRELWVIDPDTKRTEYFDFYERALINHLLGQQNTASSHGHVTYFTPLKPGGKRGVGPAWGGGTWSTDYDSFWCCQGTALETNTKLMDSIYFRDNKNSVLFVNLFASSVLNWSQRNVTVTQTTAFPVRDTTKLYVSGNSGQWTMRIRIPIWTSGAYITINGQSVQDLIVKPGTYAEIARFWSGSDVVDVRLPMRLRTLPAQDNLNIAAIAYGPVVLSGDYGSSTLNSTPAMALDTIRRTNTGLDFTAMANGRKVSLKPFYNAHGFNYNVYWAISGKLPSLG